MSRITPILWIVFLAACLATAQPAEAPKGLLLKGVNGQEVVAAGVLEARPEGMVVLIQGRLNPIVADWDKFDLKQLEQDHPTLYYGYLDAQKFQRSFLVKLGIYEGIMSFDEAIHSLNHELNKPRYYPLPPNVNYLIEEDPAVMRAKTRDINRYNKMMRDERAELQDFYRRIFPSESIIIDDTGNVHQKDRPGSVDPNRGETSLALIFTVLADTQKAPSRRGLQYLREVTTLQTEVNEKWDALRQKVANPTFDESNFNHVRLPILLGESQVALHRVLLASPLHQADQQKLSDLVTFVYNRTPKYH